MALTLASEEDVVEVYKCARVVVVALYGGAGGELSLEGDPRTWMDGWRALLGLVDPPILSGPGEGF